MKPFICPPMLSTSQSLAVASVSFNSISQPGSIVHEAEQQSPSTVLPSSHASVGVWMPSPQTDTQMVGWPAQLNPASIAHVGLQPSPPMVPPSSHASVPTIRPSPQFDMHTVGTPAQVNPGSSVHVALQP